jgi:tRNA G18 (ribose-2'-O)-methylase SpoU
MSLPDRVTDPADPRLADYVGLTDVALRRAVEPAAGMFVAEGETVIRRALAAGHPVRSMLLEERWLPGLRDVIDRTDAPVHLASRALLEAVTGYAVHRGALAVMDRLPLPEPAALARGADLLVLLEDLNDHTNIGAIFRSAAALGAGAVLLSPRCADPLYRRSVKVSMGTVFAVPWSRLTAWPGDLDLLASTGHRLLGLTPDRTAVPLDELDLAAGAEPVRLALLLGAEGAGISHRALARCDRTVRIPMAAGVDSLNVGAAAAVALYALGRGAQSRR